MHIRKAVIPAAGYGLRMFPASKAVKKELFPLVQPNGVAKAGMHLIVEEAVESGIEDVCIVVQPDGVPDFEDYFHGRLPQPMLRRLEAKPDAHREYEALIRLGERVELVVQETQEGYGHAVWCARKWVGDEPFLLLLGDHVYLSGSRTRCAKQLIDVFERYGVSTSAAARTPEDQLHLFGTIAGRRASASPDVYEVTEIREKPSPEYAREHFVIDGLPPSTYLSWFGQHAFTPQIFDAIQYHIDRDIREKGEIQLTNAQELLRQWAGRYYAVEVDGERCDFGVPEGLVRTMAALGRA